MLSSAKVHPELRRKLEEITRQSRRVRRAQCWSRFGLVTFLATATATLLFALIIPGDKLGMAILGSYVAFEGWALWRWLLSPMRHPITLEQVALFVDEQHPELDNRIASALEFTDLPHLGSSDWLIEKFLQETQPLFREVPISSLVDSGKTRRRGMVAYVMLGLSASTLLFFGQFWAPGISFVLPDSITSRPALPFTVEPGSKRVREGDNQMVWVRSDKANRKLKVRWQLGDGAWQTGEMSQSGTDKVYFHQFSDIHWDINYEVQYGGLKSEVYELTVWTPPEVDSIDLTYTYPEYLGEEPREVPNSGNIAALEGSEVAMAVSTNKKLAQAEMVYKNGDRIPLKEKNDMLWVYDLTLVKSGTYHIELTDLEGAESEYNSEYNITVEKDRAPEIRIQFPRGDSEVTMLDEIPFDFEVTDDYGFANYGLQYEISGKEPVRIVLSKDDNSLMAAEGHHEMFLEDLTLDTGDFITWTVWAEDAKPDRKDYEKLGDPFFLEIRPFLRRMTEAVSAGGGQGSGESEESPLIRAKEIIIATWHLRRDFPILLDEEFEEHKQIILDEQLKLQEEIASGDDGTSDQGSPDALRLSRAMSESIDALRRAELPDPGEVLSEAANSEREVYGHLLKMKPRDVQVQQNQGGGGGGGGGKQSQDISSLEMERNRNFYEEENVTQGMEEAAQQVLNKIKEISQRQEIVNDEIAKLISEMESATEKEKEELKRKLERLKEEMKENLARMDEVNKDLATDQLSNEQVTESRQALREARQQATRSLDQLGDEQYQQARASGQRAMDALDNIEEFLQQFSRKGAAERMKKLQEQLDDLQDRQEAIAKQAEEMAEQHLSPSFDDQKEAEDSIEALLDEKAALMDEFGGLMNEASDLAERSKESQELMAKKLGDWLRETSREGILEDMEESGKFVKFGVWDNAAEEETNIAEKLDEAAKNLREVSGHLVEDELEAMQMALENLDRLIPQGGREGQQTAQGTPGENESGLSMEMPEGGEPGEEGQGNAGRPSEDGEPGQAPGEEPGQQARGGQPGEEGQQGQSAQEGQEGEQGQGQQPGQGQGQGQSQQPGQQGQQGQGQGQGDSNSPGQQGQQASPGQGQGQQNPQGGSPQGGNTGGQPQGSTSTGNNPFAPFTGATSTSQSWNDFDLEQFAEQDYREWLERLRDAEALLPEGSDYRNDITRLREQVEALRRRYRDREILPQYDLFLETIARPLAESADRLQSEIERMLDEKEFVLVDEGDIPERYRERVANYFKNLSEAESNGN